MPLSRMKTWNGLTGINAIIDYVNSLGRGAIGSVLTALTGDVTATGPGSATATIANDAVTNAKLANMAAHTFKARKTNSTGDPEDATATEATALLDVVVGDSGSGGTKGLVPAPGAGDAAAGKFLKADGTFAVPPGTGSGATITGSPSTGDVAKFSSASSITGQTLGAGETIKNVAGTITSAGYGPSSISLLTSGTGATYTVPTGIYKLRVRVQGAGGGGGGGSGTASQMAVGSGGGSGAYAEKIYSTTPGTTYTYTVGALGTGATAGNNTGTAGGDTTFDNGGSIVTAHGGAGGPGMATGTTFLVGSSGTAATATGGDVNISGGAPIRAYRYSGAAATSANGANSHLGFGGVAGTANAGGNAATDYGAGGGGGFSNGASAQAGGNGSAGVIIVEEYK